MHYKGAVVKSLEHGHELGKEGLDAVFAVGSKWCYGDGRDVFEVIEPGAFHSEHKFRDIVLPGAPETWYIKARCVAPDTVRARYKLGYETGLPPSAMIPAAVVFKDNPLPPYDTKALLKNIETLSRERDSLQQRLDESLRQREVLSKRVEAARRALDV